MTDPLYVTGLGEVTNRRTNSDALEEMVHHAARRALSNAGLDRESLDSLVVCASDLEDGRAISSMVTVGPAGGYRKDFLKTTDTGVHALALAAMRIQSGVFDNSLVLSWGKQSEADLDEIRFLENEPFAHRKTGLGHVSGHAVEAAVYEETTQDASSAADAVAAKSVENARDNPRSISMSSDAPGGDSVVSWPIADQHLPPVSDGATALVLSSENSAAGADGTPVTVDGFGLQTASYNAGNRPFGRLDALDGAAEAAYERAEITDPREEADGAEIHAKSAYHELMACEALGLCETGDAPAATLDGAFDIDGDLPVNASGGPYASNPLIAAGLQRVTEAVRQLRGDAGYLDEEPPEQIVTHATAGYTDQTHGVAVLGRGST